MFLALAFAIVVAVAAYLDRSIGSATAKPEERSATKPLVRSDPGVDPWVEKDIPPPKSRATPIPARLSESDRPPSKSWSGYGSSADQSGQSLPSEEYDYPLPTDEQLRAANQPRHYNLPPGAVMSLTINALELRNVPILSSSSTQALDQGVIHLPGTSYPWSGNPREERVSGGTQAGMAWDGKPPRLLPPQRAGRRGEGHVARPTRWQIPLQGDRELRSRTTR